MSNCESHRDHVPGHVAIIMDGNGRWATNRCEPRSYGHAVGVEAATRAYQAARQLGVRHLTLYCFSTANFKRPADEVAVIMHLLGEYARKQRDDFIARGVRVEVVGNMDQIPEIPRASLATTIAATAGQTDMVLSLAIAYSGQLDLARAVRAVSAKVQSGKLAVDQINEEEIRRHMWTHRLPDVDLLIRTGGEQRLSDFLLVENAYSELYFDDVMWPEFGLRDLERAVDWFAKRQRRFGDVTAVGNAA